MDKIRLLFLIVGVLLFGAGMIWAGLLKIGNHQLNSGIVYIAAAIAIIALCILAFFHGKGTGR